MAAAEWKLTDSGTAALWALSDVETPPEAAGAPASVSGDATGGTTRLITWVAGSGGLADGFVVQLESPAGAGNWENAAGAANPTAAGVSSFLASGLAVATSYRPRVSAQKAGFADSAFTLGEPFYTDNSVTGGGVIVASDVTPPTLTGSIEITLLLSTSYTATCPAASDAVGVVGYQWRLGGVGAWTDIPSGGRVRAFTGRTPNTSDLLEMRARDGSGNFSSPLSTTVTLPGIAPAVTTQPTNASVTAGSVASFTAAFSGIPAPAVQWYRNGALISGATSATYSFSTVLGDSGAIFSCTATNSAGQVSTSAATLTVTTAPVAPSITTQPASQTIITGAPVTFSVVAAGSSPIGYQWRRNGVNISGATSSSYSFTTSALDDGVDFSVAITNPVGTIFSNAARLSVVTPGSQTADPTISISRGEWDLVAYRMRKQPSEVRDVIIEMKDWFAGRADSPSEVTFTVAPTGGVVPTVYLAGTRIFIIIAGGVDGGRYSLSILMSTTATPAIVREFDVLIEVVEVS